MARHLGDVDKKADTKVPRLARDSAQDAAARNGLPAGYWKACELARETRYVDARAAYLRLRAGFREARTPGFGPVQNDLAVLDAMQGKFEEACEQWRGVVEADQACLPARLNFGLVRAEMSYAEYGNSKLEIRNPKLEELAGGRKFEARESRRKFEARSSKSEWGGWRGDPGGARAAAGARGCAQLAV